MSVSGEEAVGKYIFHFRIKVQIPVPRLRLERLFSLYMEFLAGSGSDSWDIMTRVHQKSSHVCVALSWSSSPTPLAPIPDIYPHSRSHCLLYRPPWWGQRHPLPRWLDQEEKGQEKEWNRESTIYQDLG